MRLEQLRQVVVLEEQLSISKAAKMLYMTQPALSMSLTGLENELGMKLFERSANGVVPTPDEQAISCFVRGIIQDMERLEQLHEQYIGLEKSRVVAVVPALYDEVIMGVLRLSQEKPALRITVFPIADEQILDSLYTGQCDLAILSCADSQWERLERQLKMKRISYEILKQSQIKLCLRADHPLAQKTSISQADILEERVILPKDSVYILQNYGLEKNVVHPNWLAVEDHEVVKKLVVDGYGVGLIHHVFLAYDPYFSQGTLLLKELKGLEKSKSYLVYDKQRFPEAFKQEILESLQEDAIEIKEQHDDVR